jgi:hypothetical protein
MSHFSIFLAHVMIGTWKCFVNFWKDAKTPIFDSPNISSTGSYVFWTFSGITWTLLLKNWRTHTSKDFALARCSVLHSFNQGIFLGPSGFPCPLWRPFTLWRMLPTTQFSVLRHCWIPMQSLWWVSVVVLLSSSIYDDVLFLFRHLLTEC